MHLLYRTWKRIVPSWTALFSWLTEAAILETNGSGTRIRIPVSSATMCPKIYRSEVAAHLLHLWDKLPVGKGKGHKILYQALAKASFLGKVEVLSALIPPTL
eukprot:3081054-Pleurochrysis_carterae.AAC.1